MSGLAIGLALRNDTMQDARCTTHLNPGLVNASSVANLDVEIHGRIWFQDGAESHLEISALQRNTAHSPKVFGKEEVVAILLSMNAYGVPAWLQTVYEPECRQ